MDLILKAKDYELEAIAYLNTKIDANYNTQQPGIYWAFQELCLKINEGYDNKTKTYDQEFEARIKRIYWNFKLENYFSGENYTEKVHMNTHLTVNQQDYECLSKYIHDIMGLERPPRKSLLIRTALKWAIYEDKFSSNNNIPSEDKDINVRFNVASKVTEMLLNNSIEDKIYIDKIINIIKEREKRD